MSWSWPDGTFDRHFDASIGAAPVGGTDKTLMAVVKCTSTGFGALGARLGSTIVYSIFVDGGKWFFGTDFTGGPSAVAGEWMQVACRWTTATHQASWHYRQTSSGVWGAWQANITYTAGVSEGGTTIDNLTTGIVNDRSNGLIAAAGIWSGLLADATVEALDVNIPSWRASANVKTIFQMNAISSPPVAGDLIDITGGGANGTAYSSTSGNVSLGADPPGITYYTPGGGPTLNGKFFQFF